MTMGSSTVSPWASISMVAFSAVSDELGSTSTAAGGSFVVVVPDVPEGWLSSALAVGDFLFAGSCCQILLALRVCLPSGSRFVQNCGLPGPVRTWGPIGLGPSNA